MYASEYLLLPFANLDTGIVLTNPRPPISSTGEISSDPFQAYPRHSYHPTGGVSALARHRKHRGVDKPLDRGVAAITVEIPKKFAHRSLSVVRKPVR